MQPQIEHVSDTALLVAACRALENERPDALAHDPFAAKLAGDRGMALTESMAGREWMVYGMGLRTHFIDELLMQAIEKGSIGTVLNLGAGLDTRPWRLELPRDLRWIEVDFPAMLQYKATALADVEPRCHLEQSTADLNNQLERKRVLALASDRGKPVLMITEGLLMYLPADTIHSLATETLASQAFRFWIFDVVSNRLLRLSHGKELEQIENVRSESALESEGIIKAVEESGWTIADRRSSILDGWRIAQKRLLSILQERADRGEAPPEPPPTGDVSGIWLFEPKGAHPNASAKR